MSKPKSTSDSPAVSGVATETAPVLPTSDETPAHGAFRSSREASEPDPHPLAGLIGLAPPPAVVPDQEPAPTNAPAVGEDWRNVTPGSPAFPVKGADGRWYAGGLVALTLCIYPDGSPRCYHAQRDGTCSGPPTNDMRRTMTGCVGYKPMGG